MSKEYERIRADLLDQAERDQLFHAYIFEGEAGYGREDLADELAKILLQTKHPEQSADYFCLKRSEMNVESVRKMIADSFIEPFREKKVYRIEEASRMSSIMQNALLKTLEEAPPYAIFFLLCENVSALLDTLRSRCIHYYISSKEESVDSADRYEESVVKMVNELYEAVCRREVLPLMKVVDTLKFSKELLEDTLSLVILEAQHLLHRIEGEGDCRAIVLSQERLENCAEELTVFEVLRFIDIIEEARKKIGSRCVAAAVLEVMLFDILEVLGCQK